MYIKASVSALEYFILVYGFFPDAENMYPGFSNNGVRMKTKISGRGTHLSE